MSTLSFSIQLITKFMMCVSLPPTTNSKWGSLKFIKMINRIWFSHQNEYQMNTKWNSLDYFSQNNWLRIAHKFVTIIIDYSFIYLKSKWLHHTIQNQMSRYSKNSNVFVIEKYSRYCIKLKCIIWLTKRFFWLPYFNN